MSLYQNKWRPKKDSSRGVNQPYLWDKKDIERLRSKGFEVDYIDHRRYAVSLLGYRIIVYRQTGSWLDNNFENAKTFRGEFSEMLRYLRKVKKDEIATNTSKCLDCKGSGRMGCCWSCKSCLGYGRVKP